METNYEDSWVTEHLAVLDPPWQPDPARGHAALHLRLAEPRRHSRKLLAAIAAAGACAAVFAFPQTRAMAQGLWEHFVLNRVDVVRLDLSDLPLEAHVTTNGMTQIAHDLTEAEQLAGFKPNLPAGVLASTPQLTVTGPIVAEQTIHVTDLRSALAKRGSADVVPAEWEGVTMRAVIGPMLAADYPGEVQVLQSKPVSLSVPTGFPLEAFANVAFRSIGVSSRDAAVMAKKFAADPAWFVDIPPDEVVGIQDLSLVNGPALLTEEYGDNGQIARETVIRSTPDRLYAIMSPTRDLSVKIAASLP